ncbi:hypothetical protein ACFV7Q_34755 [Streptomyces sp. NPDC059851]|uniref:hypothetical protein n=1 Tax=Streptomyces sp. NPDC059851 TaxID=3346971 RepID=UPI00364659F7
MTTPEGLVRDAILASPAWSDMAVEMALLDRRGVEVAGFLAAAHAKASAPIGLLPSSVRAGRRTGGRIGGRIGGRGHGSAAAVGAPAARPVPAPSPDAYGRVGSGAVDDPGADRRTARVLAPPARHRAVVGRLIPSL